MKVAKVNDGKLMFYCEGCKENHYADSRWTFNDDFEKPTFQPSILVEIGHYPKPNDICHSFVTDGKIQYLNDCTHHLAGQTVELLDEDDWYKEDEFNPGDTVETTYSNITNKIGEVTVIYAEVIAIIDEHGDMSHHKKERLRLVDQSESKEE